MSDEQPVVIRASKKLKRDTSGEKSGLTCIVHYEHYRSEPLRRLTDHAFGVIKQAAVVRQQQREPKQRLDDICSNLPAVYIAELHGRHDKCYKAFTNTSYLQTHTDTSTSVTSSTKADYSPKRPARSKSSNVPTSILFPKDQCIFCEKGRKFRKGATDELVKCITTEAAETIQQSAKDRHDFKLLGKAPT